MSLLLGLFSVGHTMASQNDEHQSTNTPGPNKNNEQIITSFNGKPLFVPNYPLSYPFRGMPYEPNNFNLQYPPPQFMTPIRLDIQFMPPPYYQPDPSRMFFPLLPQMAAPLPFALPSETLTNKTTLTTSNAESSADVAKKKTLQSVAFSPRFYMIEDTETKVIDTWQKSKDFRYFSNKFKVGQMAKPQVNYLKITNLKKYKNKSSLSSKEKLLETPKKKNMVRIIPLKKDLLREVSAKLKQLKAQGKLTPLMGKLLKHKDKHEAINKLLNFRTSLKEDNNKIINQ